MTAPGWVFDALLAAVLPLLAWRLLGVRDLFKAVVLFIVFGLLLSLAWVRLGAPDVALAEAAIGAGVTGALLLRALAHLRSAGSTSGRQNQEVQKAGKPTLSVDSAPFLTPTRLLLALFSLILAVVLGWAVVTLPPESAGLAEWAGANLDRSGVSNPVTAVLLNFRGYDTLLEIGVLVLAAIGVLSLQGGAPVPAALRSEAAANPVLMALVRLLVPLMVIIAGYVLWMGSHAPGGAFQAGAVLAAASLLLLLSGAVVASKLHGWPLRAALVMGFGVFLAVACGVMALTGRFLEYPRDWAKDLILVIEVALTLSIAAILATLFAGSPPTAAAQTQPSPIPEKQHESSHAL